MVGSGPAISDTRHRSALVRVLLRRLLPCPACRELGTGALQLLSTDTPFASRGLATHVHRLEYNQQLLRGVEVAADAGFLEHVRHSIGQSATKHMIDPVTHRRDDGPRRRWRWWRRRRKVARNKGVRNQGGQASHYTAPEPAAARPVFAETGDNAFRMPDRSVVFSALRSCLDQHPGETARRGWQRVVLRDRDPDAGRRAEYSALLIDACGRSANAWRILARRSIIPHPDNPSRFAGRSCNCNHAMVPSVILRSPHGSQSCQSIS